MSKRPSCPKYRGLPKYRGSFTKRLYARAQVISLRMHDFYYSGKALDPVSWVIAPAEVASMATTLQGLIPDSYSFMVTSHPFYSAKYDYLPPVGESQFRRAWRTLVTEPRILAKLANSAKGFLFLSSAPLLGHLRDFRRFEFGYLKSRGVKIVCYFTGSDIRSPALMKSHELATGVPNIGTCVSQTSSAAAIGQLEERQKLVGSVASDLADAVFTMRVDQAGHLDTPTESFRYVLPESAMAPDLSKFDGESRPVVLHAPSKPHLKGTPLVRAAVEALKHDGYDFEYVELTGVPHTEVLEQLRKAHLVLNQFYSYAPGVFGVEAMASGCVVLMSADEQIEPDLPTGSNDAWVVTKHWQLPRNLKDALDHPERWREQAERAQQWVRSNALPETAGKEILEVLETLTEPGD